MECHGYMLCRVRDLYVFFESGAFVLEGWCVVQ